MFHHETWRVASWRRPKSQMGDPTETRLPRTTALEVRNCSSSGALTSPRFVSKSRSLGIWNWRLWVRSLRTDRSERLKFDRALACRRPSRANNSDDKQEM